MPGFQGRVPPLGWRRSRLYTTTIVAVAASHSIICKCLKVDAPITRTRRIPCHPSTSAGRLGDIRSSQILVLSTKSGVGDQDGDRESEAGARSLSSLAGRISSYAPVVRTAAASFAAGSVMAVALSMISFRHSLISDGQPPLHQSASTSRFAAPIEKNVVLYQSILQQLDNGYVDEFDETELFEATARSMVSTLDPYTQYISPRDMATRQNKVGIGAFVIRAGNQPDSLDGKSISTLVSQVPSPYKLPNRFPQKSDSDGFRVLLALQGYAYDAGLRVGDEILAIDGKSIAGETLERARELLLGAPGTNAMIAFKRQGTPGMQTIDIERKVVQYSSVPYAGLLEGQDGIGYIRLRRFGLDAGVSMQRALQSIQSDHKLKGLILDLRDNAGGELLSAVQTASLFFPEGTYLGSSEGKGMLYPNESYYAGKLDLRQYGYASSSINPNLKGGAVSPVEESIFEDMQQILDPDSTKVVLLVNQNTASASEFLAGVFQDLDAGVVLGNDASTLGKGIGQRELPLPYGAGALKLTYHEFHTPSGRCVQRQYQSAMQDKSKAFYTRNGRQLNDRRGVEVDVKAEPRVSLLNQLLSSSGAYFDFATEYCSQHRLPLQYNTESVVSGDVYRDFHSFVLKEQRRGNLRLDDSFDDGLLLKRIQLLSEESNQQESSLIQSSVATLRSQMVQDILSAFGSDRDVIANELEMNILARQLSDGELIEWSLKSVDLVQQAANILLDANQYNTVLRTHI